MDYSILKSQRGRFKGTLTRMSTFCEAISTTTTIQAIQIRLEKLGECWDGFMAVQDQICQFTEEPDYTDPEEETESFETKYFAIKEKLLKAINDRHPSSQEQHVSVDRLADQQASFLERFSSTCVQGKQDSQNETKLPKINIPLFSGNYAEWVSFRDLFTSTIHKQKNLTNTQKFHYLKGYLKDEAAALLRHIPISEENYTQAWDRLDKRYNKRGQITKSFIKTFLSLPSISHINAFNLRRIVDGADEVIRGLKALGKCAEGRDPWLNHLLLNKLDPITRQDWAEESTDNDFPTFNQLLEFLEKRCQALEDSQGTIRSQNPVSTKPIKCNHMLKNTSSTTQCPKCNSTHYLFNCQHFHSLDINSRRKFVNEKRLCFNCLRTGHHSSSCKSKHTCQHCSRKHHSLVHPAVQRESPSPSTSAQTKLDNIHTSPVSHNIVFEASSKTKLNQTKTLAILPTAIGTTIDYLGNHQECRILLDTGSQTSFISESFVNKLKLLRNHAKIPVVGLSAVAAGTTKGVVHIELYSKINSKSISVDTFILQRLTSNLPNYEFPNPVTTIQLADSNFNIPGPIDILLGADVVFNIFEEGRFDIATTSLTAQLTIFGWVIAGKLPEHHDLTTALCTVSSLHSNLDVDETLRRFWELDTIPSSPMLSEEESHAEENYTNNTYRNALGRYVVNLPFKVPTVPLGSTYQSAFNRLRSMERRFIKNPDLLTNYQGFMEEYLRLGHMERIPETEIQKQGSYYLPHHAVFKPDSSTTKLRVVFDGSAKSSSGYSLNDALLTGPPIQKELFAVCLRFRRHHYVFTADIEKMYRQIQVSPNHTDYQRILWRKSSTDPVEHYRLTTVTYGTSSAPFLAIRTLKQLALDTSHKFPSASKILLNDCYVDDIITGAQTPDELLSLKLELNEVLNSAGFKLRKWGSNCWPILQTCPEHECELSAVNFDDTTQCIKTLGMKWYPYADEFSFSITLPNETPTTKRSFLSEAARIFDPLGFLTPITVTIKILFQGLWLQNLSWNDPIPTDVLQHWTTIKNELPLLSDVRIPRWLHNAADDFELHGFADASERAFAAVVYSRVKQSDNSYITRLIASKSKVAPLKQISLPRLELCGALLLSHLMKTIVDAFELTSPTIFMYTDSEIVLHWLSSVPRRWSCFIANRTSKILDLAPRTCWQHVASKDNPADIASRGISPSKIIDHQLWFHGPIWLQTDLSHWSAPQLSSDFDSSTLEERKSFTQVLTVETGNTVLHDLCTRFSTWTKLFRTVAHCNRFCTNLFNLIQGKRNGNNTGDLLSDELLKAQWICIKYVQQLEFKSDIAFLRKNHQLPASSKIIKLAPFIDQQGILRVGGRLQYSKLPYNAKHPILLPKGHPLCQLIIKHYHVKYLHVGMNTLMSLLHQEYWILGSRSMIRTVIHACLPCFRSKQATTYQLMSNLPTHRVTFSRPFTHVGCDYAGPITRRLARGRRPTYVKAYIALFVCFTSKAIHIELVSDLTTEAFIAALRRFMARRGKCSHIYSDNGTNFKGAQRMLDEMQRLIQSREFNTTTQRFLSEDSITWSFNPPAAPHFGGLWEAGVKSVKTHLKRVIGDHILTFEELTTVLTQIEAVLNSRPLCSLPDNDNEALTPFHLLTGHSYSTIPNIDLSNEPPSRLSNWQLLQNLLRGFWKAWESNYLTTLQQRPKWHGVQQAIQENDMVVLKDMNMPPSKWLLGRVIKQHPGKDGLTRVVTVKTKHGEFIRPIVKLVQLPGYSSGGQNVRN